MHLFQQFGLNLSTDKKTTLKSLYINRSESGSAFANLNSVEFPAINPFLDGRSRDLMPIHQVFKVKYFGSFTLSTFTSLIKIFRMTVA